MMQSKQMTARGVIFILSLFLFAACSKDDSDAGQISWEDFKFAGVFTGNYTNNTSSQLEGYLTIEDNGNISVEVFNGGMSGTAVEDGENYNITINQSSGIFENVNNITGTLDTEARTITLNGSDAAGASVIISGEVSFVQSGDFSNSLSKSTILFTHSETDCVASVTVNGITLNGLENFYEEGNYCDSKYDIFRIMVRDKDDDESKLFCNSGTLIGLDGTPLPFIQCSVMQFIVNKNTVYDYTVTWNNGEVTTGQFTSPDGGKYLTICPTSDNCGDGGGGGNQSGTGQFIFNGTTFTTSCASVPATGCSGSGIDVLLTPQGGANTFIIYNMPTASSGTFTIIDWETAVGTCELYGVLNGSSQLFGTESGSLTKTGANSFTFSAVVKDLITNETSTISGSGTY